MTYNFNFAISAKILPSTVKEMIKTIVEAQTGRKVSSIDFDVKNVTKGWQRDEYTEAVFEGVTVTFQSDQPAITAPTKTQKNIRVDS